VRWAGGSNSEWATALPDGGYQRALRLPRTAVDRALPVSNDLLSYVLRAVGRVAEADAFMTNARSWNVSLAGYFARRGTRQLSHLRRSQTDVGADGRV
jgi:hypothetical protein